MDKATGIELITAERKRQIEKEGFTAEHDADWYHEHGELAFAAACYASPLPPYRFNMDTLARGNISCISFMDCWPTSWATEWDKRKRHNGNVVANRDLCVDARIRNLVKAGALIAAEIDRLTNLQENSHGSHV